ncbi:hypothetical protein AB0Q95_35980 [Streptomyces sp. NPDC059900]|uniref:hypothetical protein n=1 Tax=Streptomyces sp. NPDC059900 TaxID=3155816 RepID=UPI00343D6E88
MTAQLITRIKAAAPLVVLGTVMVLGIGSAGDHALQANGWQSKSPAGTTVLASGDNGWQ